MIISPQSGRGRKSRFRSCESWFKEAAFELSLLQNKSLVREYVKKHFTEQGMCADVCIHDTGGGNPHAHIMLTMRPFTEEKTWGDKQKKEYILDPQGEKIYDNKEAFLQMQIRTDNRLE